MVVVALVCIAAGGVCSVSEMLHVVITVPAIAVAVIGELCGFFDIVRPVVALVESRVDRRRRYRCMTGARRRSRNGWIGSIR